MKHAFTPGPWYYTKTPIVGFVVRSSNRKNNVKRDRFIADCGKVHYEPFDPEFEANARLIAAAPDLLEACKRQLKEHNDRDALGLCSCRGCDMARAAITKAEDTK